MRAECIKAVSQALGRGITSTEARDIERRVSAKMRLLAREKPAAWAALPADERLRRGAEAAAVELEQEAALKKRRQESALVKKQALLDFVERQVASGKDKLRTEAVHRILAPKADMGGAPELGSVDAIAQGEFARIVSRMVETFELGKRRGVWKYIPFNEPGTNAMFRRALHGETQGVPPEFVEAARVAKEEIELLRERYNALGGAVGKLEDWNETQRWSPQRLAKAIRQRGKAAVVEDFVDAADLARYINEDGTPMTRDQLRSFMGEALTTILSDGANKTLKQIETGQPKSPFATSVIANRHRAHREIHLKRDMSIAMLDKYSELDAMASLHVHLRTLARDVALLEVLGPNPKARIAELLDEAEARDAVAFEGDMPMQVRIKAQRSYLDALFRALAGETDAIDSAFGATMQTLRSLNVFALLGSTVLNSVTDPVNMQMIARSRGLSHGKLFINDVAQFAGFGRRWAKRAGLITDTVVSFADRHGFDNFDGRDTAAKAASFTLKTSGLNWVTEARRAAWGLSMMDAFGHLVRRYPDMARMKADDARAAGLLNVDQAVWDVWRLAKLESRGANQTILSPQSIYAIPDAEIARVRPNANPDQVRADAAMRLLAIIKDETNTAVITASTRDRVAMTAGTQAGSTVGELARTIMLFKSYPWTFMVRHIEVARTMGGPGNQLAYGAALFITMTMAGIIANWLVDLANGRDPRSINPNAPEGGRNIIAGMAKGGGLGFLGDFLFANLDPANQTKSFVGEFLAGPVGGLVEDTANLTLTNVAQAAAGDNTSAGPEAVRMAQRLTPNLWYTRAVTDRYIFNVLAEEIEPGYIARRNRRAEQVYGASWWWRPTEAQPERAPDLSQAVSE